MHLRRQYSLPVFLFLVLLSPCAYAWQGKVVGVSDGDTITVLHDGKREKIRLYGIDAPEYNQDFGAKAKKFTSQKVYGRQVQIEPVTTDSSGRTVGLVFIDDTCLNEELIKNGFAWVYRHFCDKPVCKNWLEMEDDIRKYGWGLWSDPNPTPPWKFRHAHGKAGAAAVDTDQQAPQDSTGGANAPPQILFEGRHYTVLSCRDLTNTAKKLENRYIAIQDARIVAIDLYDPYRKQFSISDRSGSYERMFVELYTPLSDVLEKMVGKEGTLYGCVQNKPSRGSFVATGWKINLEP